ncbi:MAG: ATPase, partial [Alteraurantiacibacter sp.]|nr:ATPase [Alteraurantiacibacter sp.]
MRQIALPLTLAGKGPSRIVIGSANAHVAEALARPANWPFHTAVLTGPPRSGKSLLARWFVSSQGGMALDDAHMLPEDDLFHGWNRAQESGTPLLVIGGEPPWH